MSPTSNPQNEAPKPSDETETVRRPVIPEAIEAAEDPGTGRSPGKTDRGIAAKTSADTADAAKSEED